MLTMISGVYLSVCEEGTEPGTELEGVSTSPNIT